MKKIIGFMVLVLCVCITATCYAQESAEIPYEEFIGGMSREGAKQIPEAKYGRLLKGNIKSGKSAWYIFEAEESGDLLLDVNVLNDSFGFGVSFKFYEAESKSSIESQKTEDRYTFVYPVTKGQQYCIEIKRVWNGDADYSISLCFDGYHMPVGEPELMRRSTCAKEGEQSYACALCSYTAKIEKLPKLPHTLGEWVNKAQPTCTRDGLDVLPCAVCGETVENKVIPAKGHGELKELVTKEPTCTEKGTRVKKCIACSETVESETIPATGHGELKDVVTKEPTCIVEGVREKKCIVCSAAVESESIPAMGHARAQTVIAKEPTCTMPGISEQKCPICAMVIDQVEIPATGHVQTKEVVGQEANCMRAGVLETRCVSCQEVLATASIPQKEEHTPGKVQTVREATCTANGRGEQRCEICNLLLKEETTTAYGHSYSEWMTVAEPTKEQEGQNARYCSYCGHTETQVIEKLPKILGIF